MRLTTKIMSVLLATVVLFTAVAGYFSVRSAYNEVWVDQQQLARRLGDQLHRRIASVWQRDGLAGIGRLVGELSDADPSGVKVRWVWFEQAAATAQRPHGGPEQWAAVREGKIVSMTSRDDRRGRLLHTYLQLPTESGRSGGLELTHPLTEVERHMRQTIWQSILSIGGLAMVCIGIAYLAGLIWVAHPLESLIDKTRRIGEGDFSDPLVLPGNDELSQLASAVNQMCEKLDDQQQRIRTESSQRLETLEQLRHADRLKTVGRLAAGVAHELGTPLNVVAGRAGLIASGKLSEEDVRSSARTIKSETDRMVSIVRQLLDFARQRPAQRTSMDLVEAVGQTLEMLSPLADKNGVSLDLRRPRDPVIVDADKGQIQQAVTNIVMNAVQVVSAPSPVTVDVASIEREVAGSHLMRRFARIRIEDKGPGIAQDVAEHIFEPFFTTKDVGQGTGLGLSIVHGIVHEHGGTIEVMSRPGEGTCFEIFLPQEAQL